MITDGFIYIAVLVALAALMVGIESKFSSNRFFKFIPGIVLIYIGAALLQTIGLFDNEATESSYVAVKDALLPAMLMLMLLKCDIRSIIKLGPRMLGGYFVAVISIIIGFTVVYLIFNQLYAADTWRAFGALAGSWTGGSANMVALQDILQVPENIFGYILMMDTINYAVWVMFMFWLVPFAGAFNRWTKADITMIDNEYETNEASSDNQGIEFKHIIYLLGIGLFVSALATLAGDNLPELGDVFSATTWTILIASVVGLVLGQTRLSKIPGALDVSNVMLYIIIALIASHSDFSQIAQAPIYIISGFLIMLVHLIIMLLLGKLFKLDLFTLGIASLANIGGMASAPMLAAAYSKTLIPVGVIMALIGSFLGTYFGMLVGKILEML
ncbi:membrane protein [Oceanobacillus oncorhynchi subsp. incaldanensis]|uniref:DUF819 domain-containing protein n=1 Tax=Oceanobacillus oncorhynchi TaxID=545501 RepID=A0A0A1MLH9_9BACI|nr:DUF819 family protein [Oceanobacillus oncorhynchi]MDM8098894.1 DUF819 family protein [Oceanobacillus oncorhynchi]UUI39676.1 DUF819 family protein [Oceanobacillus oncorhynchi]GIO19077.1 membrane protein [Oceanobacillus oncorhynchi subsp. incaldanensis]CEI80689.1 hypothetical protein BN997_00497 [Oceanobacillus oncorhynchi]